MGFVDVFKKKGSSAPKSAPSEVKLQASKSPPQPSSQRQKAVGSSSGNTDKSPHPRMLVSSLISPSPAPIQTQQPIFKKPAEPDPKRQVWYCCLCLIQKKPPLAQKMSRVRCGWPNPEVPDKKKSNSNHHSRCARSCLIQREDEDPPIWCLALSRGMKIPLWSTNLPWISYLPFKNARIRNGADV